MNYEAYKIGTRMLLGTFQTLEQIEAYVKGSDAYTVVMTNCRKCKMQIRVEPASAGPMNYCMKCSIEVSYGSL